MYDFRPVVDELVRVGEKQRVLRPAIGPDPPLRVTDTELHPLPAQVQDNSR